MMPESAEGTASSDTKAKKLEQIEKSVRSRVECEERAFRIVNKLIDDYVDGDYLVDCARFINRDHYNDIVEERAISCLCGYPVCPNSLGKTPNKKYHVSTKTNKVYEISERKNFCSNRCFKASRHFSAQIPESPLWIRDKEQLPSIALLDQDKIKGIVGDEVIGHDPKYVLKEELESLEVLDKRTSSSKKKFTQTPTDSSSKRVSTKASSDRCSEETETPVRLDQNPHDFNKNKFVSDGNPSESGNVTEVLFSSNDSSVVSRDGSKSNDCDVASLSREFDQLSTEATEVIKDPPALYQSKEIPMKLTNSCAGEGKIQFQKRDQISSKMDHLKALLSKHKTVLYKMVDVQTVQQDFPQTHQTLKGDSHDKLQEKEIHDFKNLKNHSKSESCENPSLSSSTKMSPQSHNNPAQGISRETSNKSPQSHTNTNQGISRQTRNKSPLLLVCDILKSWLTPETNLYLSSGSDSEESLRFSNWQVQQDYRAVCHRLAAREKQMEAVLDGDEASDTTLRPTKPVPDYKALREQTEAFKLNVMEFITGKKQVPQKDRDSNADEDNGIRLPTVDAYDQHQIRVRIVMDRLDKCLHDVLAPLSLSLQDVSGPIRELVHTCRLEKDNIVLRPGEWTLAALLILRMLATRHPRIGSSFTKDLAIRHFSAVMTRLGHKFSDLENFALDIIRSSQNSY